MASPAMKYLKEAKGDLRVIDTQCLDNCIERLTSAFALIEAVKKQLIKQAGYKTDMTDKLDEALELIGSK